MAEIESGTMNRQCLDRRITQMTTAQAIVDSLIQAQVNTIFGIPGAQIYSLFDALHERRDEINCIVTRHEQGAAWMAFGYAKSTGKPGVYSVVPGPGMLNTGAALCTAYGANAEVMLITGQIPAASIGLGNGELHELPDQLALLEGLTKWAKRVNHPSEVRELMSVAFHQISTGRPRPVALEVPWDVFGMKAPVPKHVPYREPFKVEADYDLVKAASKLLQTSSHPIIFVGSGAIHAGDEILELAKTIQAPVISYRSGRGIVSEASPYGFNCAQGLEIFYKSDLMIGFGTRLELPYLRWMNIPNDMKTIRVDIDPTEIFRRDVDVAIVGDSATVAYDLAELLQNNSTKIKSREEEFQQIKDLTWEKIQKVQPQMSYLKVIREVLPKDGFLVEEISQVGFTSYFGFPIYKPRTYVSCGYQGTLGFGFNTALGVKVANPDKQVVSINGDGGFMFGVQELATAAAYNINVVVIVFNNNAYGNVRRDQLEKFNGHIYGSDLINPDFVKLSNSFGLPAARVNSPNELRKQLEVTLTNDTPMVIEVTCARGSEVSPWEFLMPAMYHMRSALN